MRAKRARRHPSVARSAWVSPDATVLGDVLVGPGSRVLPGARLVGEGGGVLRVGRCAIIMENAVVRATARHPCTIGNYCLIGPNAHVVGAHLADEVFVATGAAIFHGARLGREAEVRVHATVHLRTRLPAGGIVPIGWVAVGDPPVILPPDRHEEIWAVQKPLNFPLSVYGVDRDAPHAMRRITRGLSKALGAHRDDPRAV